MKILVFGGTGEAHQLCLQLQAANMHFVHARAGILRSKPLPYPYRDGGFGGVDGLCSYLRAHGFSHLVSVTHPFAEQIAANVQAAAQRLQLPLIRLERPVWQQPEGAHWRGFAELESLINALPSEGRVLLTLGRKQLVAFVARPDLWCLWRVIEPSGIALNGQELVARPPFSFEREMDLMRRHAIQVVVSKQSGGKATFAKIEAAAALGIPVYMLLRPKLGFTHKVQTSAQIQAWLQQQQQQQQQ